MKAFLLAAGLGTRLRPLTDNVPKCMLPINGQPILYHWFKLLKKHNINKVLINTHYLPIIVERYIREFAAKDSIPNITLFYEKELLGSAGTIKANKEWVKHERDFLIAYTDNLTNADLAMLINFHRSNSKILTMGLFRSNQPNKCGIATLESDGRIINFIEKPDNPQDNLANAGIYIANPELLDYIPNGFADLGYDVLPKLIGKMHGCVICGYIRDIGTIDSYIEAQEEWSKIRQNSD